MAIWTGFTGFGVQGVISNSGPIYDNDAIIYFAGITANGGTISTSTKLAISNLFVSLKAGGVWTSLTFIAPISGNNLAASIVGYRCDTSSSVIMGNTGFVSGDYTETTGLQGSNTGKWLDTLVDIPSMNQLSAAWGVFALSDSTTTGSIHCFIGSSYPATGDNDRCYMLGNGSDSGIAGAAGLGSDAFSNFTLGTGWWLHSYNGLIHNGYRNLINVFSFGLLSTMWQKAGTVLLFNGGGENFSSDSRIGFGVVGSNISLLQNTALYNAIVSYNAAIGRN